MLFRSSKPGWVVRRNQIENPIVRGPARAASAEAEIAVAVAAELTFVTAGAELRVGACGNGVRNMEIGPVHIHHLIAQRSHLVGKTGLMAVEAVALLMAGGAVRGVAFGRSPMVDRPDRSMGVEAGELNLLEEILVVAILAELEVGRSEERRVGQKCIYRWSPKK